MKINIKQDVKEDFPALRDIELASFETLRHTGARVDEGWLHIAQIDVHPDWQRRGAGRQLINRLLDEARARRLKGATLTTDRFAAFNAPFYAPLQFQIIEEHVCPRRLKAILETEKKQGRDPRSSYRDEGYFLNHSGGLFTDATTLFAFIFVLSVRAGSIRRNRLSPSPAEQGTTPAA